LKVWGYELKHVFSVAFVMAMMMFSGCAAKIGDLQKYVHSPMRDAEFMPSSSDMKEVKTKVILIKMQNGSVENAHDADLAQTLNAALLSELTSDGSVEVIDREIDSYLSSEVKFSELSAKEDIYKDEFRIASFAIKGEISAATFSSRYVAEQIWYDKKGKSHYEPPYFVYSAHVEGVVNIYEIPSMRVLKSVALRGSESYSEESYRVKRFDAALIQKAGRDAIYGARRQLKNFFAPKGYVLFKRVNDDEQIYEVSLGSAEGLHHGDAVQVYRKHNFLNPITQEENIKEIVIAKGSVSEIIHPHNAWIIIDEVSAGFEIRLGDYIKERHSSW
jgi:hypothetical protein